MPCRRTLAAIACLLGVAAVLGWRLWAEVGARTAPAGSAAVPVARPPAIARGTDFPWHRGMPAPATPPEPAAPVPAGGDRPFSAAVHGYLDAPPPRPVWEMLRGYRGPGAGREAADAGLLAALVWCAQARDLPQQLQQARSTGRAAEPHTARLEAWHAQAATLCARLGPADDRVAAQILRWHADAGHPDAQLHFTTAGPSGIFQDVSERARIPLSDADLAAWERDALAHLRRAGRHFPREAYPSLSVLLDPRPPYDTGVLFQATRDPVEAHAYRLLWAATLKPHPSVAEAVARESAHLSPAQRAAAHERAQAIAATDGTVAPPAPRPPAATAQ